VVEVEVAGIVLELLAQMGDRVVEGLLEAAKLVDQVMFQLQHQAKVIMAVYHLVVIQVLLVEAVAGVAPVV
jgi:hypothetical protein